jgi:hypothetical protein
MNSKFKTVIAVLLFPFLWVLLGTILYLVITMLNGGVEEAANKGIAAFFGVIIMIICYVIIFTPED